MARVQLPVTKCDDVDVGVVVAVTAAVATYTFLDAGQYKIAAMGTSLLWKLGAIDVTVATGSYLADGDQEVILVRNPNTDITFIRSANSTADGQANIVVANAVEFPGTDGRPYYNP